MGLMDSSWRLLRYKLRHVGLASTLRVAYLDLTENLLYRLDGWLPFLAGSPRSIQIECTTRCNLKCTMCEISYWTEKGGNLEFDPLRQMVDHLPGLKRVDLTGIGEALMNPDFFRAVEYLKSRGLYVTLNDNVTLMTEKAAGRLLAAGVDQIFLSLDGGTKETFEQIRVGANFDKVIANTRRLIRMRDARGQKRPEVKINTVVTSTNHGELRTIVDLAHDMGIGMVQFVNVIIFEDTSSLDTRTLDREVREQFRLALERARALGILVKIELFDKLPVQRCDFPWKRNFVTYDGYVHPCCYTTQTGDRRAQNQRSLGKLTERPFAEIWRDGGYTALRGKMRQGTLPFQCASCPKYAGRPDPERGPGSS